MQHQYIERESGDIRSEKIFADRIVKFLYSTTRENAPLLFKMLTSAQVSGLLGYMNYDFPLGTRLTGGRQFLRSLGVDLSECLDTPEKLNTARKVFERKIRYWEFRPMTEDFRVIVSPADSKALFGSLYHESALFLKEKFFSYEELLGGEKVQWLKSFERGNFAIFRLTPEKYHYSHCPVSGRVVDFYEVQGQYHSCNPDAVIAVATPYSKNKRVVTVIDTDVYGGTGVGLVAMIEVVALMIGEVVQAYSEEKYNTPQSDIHGVFLRKGSPKSLFRPGSSTDVLLFQKDRVHFDQDLMTNLHNRNAYSRFSHGFGVPLVETDLKVRSSIGRASDIA